MLDNAPTALLPGRHYGTLVSADNFGLGKIAAEGLSTHLPQGAEVGLLGYAADFFATNEREIAFTKWLQTNRPDLDLHVARFDRMDEAAAVAKRMVAEHPALAGLFVVWDTPAMAVSDWLRHAGRSLPIATVDLGEAAAIDMAPATSPATPVSRMLLWSALAPVRGAVIAPGVVKTERDRKTVRHQEGGIVQQLLVRQGQAVQRGEATDLHVVGEEARGVQPAALRAVGRARGKHARDARGLDTWIGELCWRDFYKHILVGFPHVCRHQAFKRETDAIAWRHDDALFRAWCEGRTGYPVVDAAMRQLLETGWMHNRLRMIVAMFLTKNLLIDWREGERFFMRHLIDGDLAANNGGWQWSSSTGTDSAPYFRIFNPLSQSQKFDPDGRFIRQWLPELVGLNKTNIHNPAGMGGLFGIADYSTPIVDLSKSRARALAAFKSLPHFAGEEAL